MPTPRANIDLDQLERLCQLQATDEEIAHFFGLSVRTIERRRLEPEFAAIMARGRAKGRISVRRLQMKLLEEGNATIGVWLGKNVLGQTDQLVITGAPVIIVAPTPQMTEANQDLIEGGTVIDIVPSRYD
jgi:hypothetical protein